MNEWSTEWTSDRFQAVFWATKRAMKAAADAAYQRHGVREGQQFVLICLWEQDGLTPGEIARKLGLATPTVTRTATRMEAAGLVERRPHPTDARLVLITLTERGRELRQALDAEMRELSERALRTLSDQDREQFIRYLDELRRNLSQPARPTAGPVRS